MNDFLSDGIPMGLGMALAQNPVAYEKFAAMDSAEKQQIIDGTHSVNSRAEMRSYVERIADS